MSILFFTKFAYFFRRAFSKKIEKMQKEMLDNHGEGRYNITCALKALLVRAKITGCGAVW